MKIKTEKVASDAAKKTVKGLGKFLAGAGAATVAILAAAEEQRREERESLENIQEAIEVHQERFGSTTKAYHTTRKCTAFTAFWDCEDANCIYHQSEKNRRKIGTPTRNYRKES